MTETVSAVLAGCGNMGHAMLRGWLASGVLAPGAIHVVEPADALRMRAEAEGVHAVATPADLAPGLAPSVVVLAVKPQLMADVLPAYRRFAQPGSDTVFVSVAAGTRISAMEAVLGPRAAIVRVMPNTPAAVGQGMMVMCANSRASDRQIGTVRRMMAASGRVATIEDEGLMDAVTAVSGSGPAYVFHMIEALRTAGERAGLPAGIAAELALQTVHGAGIYAARSADDPARLREQVTSPNGTTAAALSVLMRPGSGLTELMSEAVEAARRRGEELGG